jgi:hypothetical protein
MKTLKFITLLFAVLLAATASANTVDFDSLVTGTVYGAPAGHLPGNYVFSEGFADCYVNDFWVGGSPYFNFMRVDPAFTYFGNNNIMNINNITLEIDFTAAGDATFDYLYLGGEVNLQFDGLAAPLVGPDFVSLAGTYGAVTVNVTAFAAGPGIAGVVTLTGPVQHLRIGGQELWVEGPFCDNGISPVVGGCDYEVTYDYLGVGTEFGSTVGMSPGDFAFIEDNIPVFVEQFDTGSGMFFYYMRIVPAFAPIGNLDIAMVNNINQRFDIGALGITTDSVSFEYYDQGGTENLSVNGAPLYVGELHAVPAAAFPGVSVSVTTTMVGPDIYGEVVITGNVQELIVGGQEFHMDNVCVKEDVPLECWHMVDHESLPAYARFGNGYGQLPGDLIFVEDNIPVLVDTFDYGSGPSFYYCETMPASSGMGDGNVMWMNNISNVYDIAATGVATTEVHFEYLDVGGTENLQVNGGALYIGDLHLAPANIAPGVTFSVVTIPIPGGVRGEVTLTGHVDKLLLGGQEFAVDNICVIGDPNTSAQVGLPSRAVALRPNHPNPFNPSTTLQFSLSRDSQVRLTVHDLKGRAVRTLVAGDRPAGDHSVVWDGRDDGGEAVGSGVYFVRVETRDGVDAQKISLIK